MNNKWDPSIHPDVRECIRLLEAEIKKSMDSGNSMDSEFSSYSIGLNRMVNVFKAHFRIEQETTWDK